MRVDIKPQGGDRYKRALAGLNSGQIAQATAEGINMALGRVKNAMRAEMQSVFDRPTNFILQSIQVKKATASNLNAEVVPTYMGRKGVDPQDVLAAQEEGGRRRDKRSEVALRRAGILPNGYQTAIPSDRYGGPYPGTDDGHGNLKGSVLVQLIAYFQAFGVDGYRFNMTPNRMKALHQRGGKGVRFMGPVKGIRYIVSYGDLRGGARRTARGDYDQRASNLGPGIWAITGTGGADVRAVLMFVRVGNYKPRISLDAIGKRAGVDELIPRWIRGRVYDAFKKASLG